MVKVMDLKMDGKRRESFTFLAWLVATPAAMAGLLTIYFCVGAIEWGDWTIPGEVELRHE